jgi:nucleoside 2-deoxyribosyltransferase
MKIYLAAPYTSSDKHLVEHRVKQINQAAAKLMREGHIVFSPISHSHQMAIQEVLPTTFEWWRKQNHAFIEWADAVCVLLLDGWEKSVGVMDEIDFALELGKRVEKMEALS